MPNLTLLSVVSYDYKYFEINYKLTSKLNDKKSFNWLVVQNKSYFGKLINSVKQKIDSPKLNRKRK